MFSVTATGHVTFIRRRKAQARALPDWATGGTAFNDSLFESMRTEPLPFLALPWHSRLRVSTGERLAGSAPCPTPFFPACCLDFCLLFCGVCYEPWPGRVQRAPAVMEASAASAACRDVSESPNSTERLDVSAIPNLPGFSVRALERSALPLLPSL